MTTIEKPNVANGPDARQGTDRDLVLGYISCPQDASSSYLGALLIADSRTRPLHFAHVAPVRPTVMQRLLYGGTLNEHVRVDVIAKRLFSDGVPQVPDVLFVDDEQLLAVRRIVSSPTAFLQKRPPGASDGSSLSTIQYKVDDHSGDEAFVGQALARLEQAIDLLEPFDRIRDALKEALRG